MRSNMIRKRALEQTNAEAGKWPTNQGTDEVDSPNSKAINPPASAIKPGVGKDAGAAEWAEGIIKSTVQWAVKHKSKDIIHEAAGLPITSKVGIAALRGPLSNFASTGDANKLSSELEMLVSGKRSIASKRKKSEKLPETFPSDKRNIQEEAPSSKPSSENKSTRRTVKLDEATKGEGTPSAWAIDNTREQWRKPNKEASTPTSWSVDNTRKLPEDKKKMTGEDQIQEKIKNGSLELYEPKTAAEIDMVVTASPEWVERRLHTGSLAVGAPRFIINASEAVAVVSAAGEVFDGKGLTNKFASVLKTSAEGGAEEEEESEEATSVDTTVVQLLEACKREWTSLGEPVNPGTWPKEIERAILALNDDLVAAIKKVEDKLVEGDFYSKNVDEGVEQQQGGSMLDGLNVAPAEEGMVEESEEEIEPKKATAREDEAKAKIEDDLKGDLEKVEVTASKRASAEDVTSTETRKALKFTQTLKEDIASKFFDFKKNVQSANDSSAIKNIGETLVALKVKLEDVEKVLVKQLDMLEGAEKAIADKKSEKKSSMGKIAKCVTCGATLKVNGVETNGGLCPTCSEKAAKPGTPKPPTTPSSQPKTQAPGSPAAPANQPQTGPVKHYGSKMLAGLNIASQG
ncbi:MAG: hypothetical protein WCQ50_14835 [Spirochaetota bacterium]